MCELNGRIYMIYPKNRIVCIDFGKIPAKILIKLPHEQPWYVIQEFEEQPVGIKEHNGQFFVMFDKSNLIKVYTQDWSYLGDIPFQNKDTLHFNLGRLHVIKNPVANQKNQVTMHMLVQEWE